MAIRDSFLPLLTAYLAVLSLSACQPPEAAGSAPTSEDSAAVQTAGDLNADESDRNGTPLCTINGQAWTYDEVSAFTNQDRKSGDQLAYITFTNHREPRKESIQLHYNVASQTVTRVIISLRPADGDGTGSANYNWNPNKQAYYPHTRVSGTVAANGSTLSGSARFENLDIAAGSSLSENQAYRQLTVQDLEFNGVPYDDHTAMLEGITPGR